MKQFKDLNLDLEYLEMRQKHELRTLKQSDLELLYGYEEREKILNSMLENNHKNWLDAYNVWASNSQHKTANSQKET